MRVRRTLLALSQLDAIQDYIAEDNPLAAFEVTTEPPREYRRPLCVSEGEDHDHSSD